jgi:transglutaminase-like putative cysteine protease
MQSYLRATDVLDFHHPAVAELAARLAAGDPALTARRAFDWVRDEIRHTADYALDTVTCSASEALLAGTGYCYAKAHLFAALCRASGIPAGLCYQRLQDGDRLVLHGLAAVHLPSIGWYRGDPRGNKPGIDARFDPPRERLAFSPGPTEQDLPEIWPDPVAPVVEALRTYRTRQEIAGRFPDMPLGAVPRPKAVAG